MVISGPSGAGKTTVCKRLIEQYGYARSVSVTTRVPRSAERNGVDYEFVSQDAFREAIQQGALLEHSQHFDNYYGTRRAAVERALAEGRTILLEIDVNGARQVMDALKAGPLLAIFLYAPDADEQERRLRERHSESEASIRTRLQRPELEMARSLPYDHWVCNDDVDRAVQETHRLIQQAKERNPHGC